MAKLKTSMALAGVVILLIASKAVFAGTVKFHYDDANRMTRVVADDGTAFEYDYDNEGNKVLKADYFVSIGYVRPGGNNSWFYLDKIKRPRISPGS